MNDVLALALLQADSQDDQEAVKEILALADDPDALAELLNAHKKGLGQSADSFPPEPTPAQNPG